MSDPIGEMTLSELQFIMVPEDTPEDAKRVRHCPRCGQDQRFGIKKVRLLSPAGAQSYLFWECPEHPLADMMAVTR